MLRCCLLSFKVDKLMTFYIFSTHASITWRDVGCGRNVLTKQFPTVICIIPMRVHVYYGEENHRSRLAEIMSCHPKILG